MHEDNHIIVVNKPSGIPTMAATGWDKSLDECVKSYLKENYDKKGNVFLGTVTRLDKSVSGAVVFARTSKALSRLALQFKNREVKKTYLAIVEGSIRPTSGSLVNYLNKNETLQKVVVVSDSTKEAKRAELVYRIISLFQGNSFVEISLLTGRKHQIRVQFSHLGFPILGDEKYGGKLTFPTGIALHARKLEFQHPVTKLPLIVTAPLPKYWPSEEMEIE